MRIADSLLVEAIIQYMVGLDTDYFQGDGDYTTFIRTHLMPPLIRVHAGDTTDAPVAGGRLAGDSYCAHMLAADWDSLSNFDRATKGRAEICQSPRGTLGAHGVHRGPSPAGHFSDSTCTEGHSDSCSTGGTSSSDSKEGRQAPAHVRNERRGRGRGKGVWGQSQIKKTSSSSEPILSGDDAKTNDTKEAVSRPSKLTESGDDDSGSQSESEEGTKIGSKSRSRDDDTGAGSESDSNNGADGDNMVWIKRKHEELEIKKSVYGDGKLWFKGPIIRKSSNRPIYLATLKKPKWRLTHLPILMVVKSAKVSDSAMLQREATVLSNFHACPYIYRCFGEEIMTGDCNHIIYNILLEYGSGETIADLIKKSGGRGLPEFDVRCYTRHILEGLDCVHSSGYVHRALKPKNIIIVSISTSTGTKYVAKVGDFGLAKQNSR
ncbi:hypothetical protein ACSBR2_042520 [Camellia fascicularis]